LLYIDIDQFGLVNDLYDEVSGDEVLSKFATLLAGYNSEKSSIARLDGNSFACLLLERSVSQAMDYAENLRKKIANNTIEIEADPVSFTVSIGVTAIDQQRTSDALLKNAELACREAKNAGRNRVEQFKETAETQEQQNKDQEKWVVELETYLSGDGFILQAQPIERTSSCDGSHESLYEILLGIVEEDGSITSPLGFISAAEKYGRMTDVDRWVVHQAFGWISELTDKQKKIPSITINLSGESLSNDAFVEFLFEQISEYGIGTNKLCFEITEAGTLVNTVKASDFVRAFKNIGCQFSLDDFGTNTNSHNALRELPVDFVKIDGSFIANIEEDPSAFAMVKSINNLAHFLGQKTVAEFVETQSIADKLKSIGVDYLQGWGVGKPKPLKEISALLDMVET